MNCQRLLSILLVGMLLSACAPFKHYRTDIPDLTTANSLPFKCKVDASLAVPPGAEALPLCENENSPDSHAIQHRLYQTKDAQPGDYYLSFVEFDDQGWFADRRQMEALFALLKKLEEEEKNEQTNGHILIQVYAHGWKHNASACDNNVVCFSRLLERTDLAEKGTAVLINDGDNIGVRKVVGIYLGWRGLPYDGVLNNLSFWSRKETAARVGRGGVFELLTRLKDYRDSRQNDYCVNRQKDIRSLPEKEQEGLLEQLRKDYPDCVINQTPPSETTEATPTRGAPTQLVITGHSFGGLIIYSALSHALMERAAKTTTNSKGTHYNRAKSFGDFVMLVNPAFEGSLYEPLFHIATNRCYDDGQRPVMMIVTSQADSATRVAFPIGRTLSTFLEHAKSPDQAQSMRKTIGHNPRYRTHSLTSLPDLKTSDEKPDNSDCGCPYLTPTSKLNLEELLGQYYDSIIEKSWDPNSPDLYGKGLSLEPASSPMYASNYPYLVVTTDEGVIADHNAIYNERFITFAQLFFLYHIGTTSPLTGDSGPKCWRANEELCKQGALVPCKQSCQFDHAGKTCIGQTPTS